MHQGSQHQQLTDTLKWFRPTTPISCFQGTEHPNLQHQLYAVNIFLSLPAAEAAAKACACQLTSGMLAIGEKKKDTKISVPHLVK